MLLDKFLHKELLYGNLVVKACLNTLVCDSETTLT